MESVDAAERKWACVAVSNLIQNDPSTRRLLQGKNVVSKLAEFRAGQERQNDRSRAGKNQREGSNKLRDEPVFELSRHESIFA